MNNRTHESPMDFSYDNGTGPMDQNSPFANIKRNQIESGKKRSYAVFGSPTKTTAPSLRAPASEQKHLFSSIPSSASKPLPSVPHKFNPAFSTPRKLDLNDFESSGGETPKSPERNGDMDSDAATPEPMGFRSRFAILDNTTKPEFTHGGKPSASPQKESNRRQSWWRTMQIKMSPSANSTSNSSSNRAGGKGTEYSHAAERKIMKRRNKQQQALAQQHIIISDSDDNNEQTPEKAAVRTSRKVSKQHLAEADSQQQGGPYAQQQDKPHWMYTFFQFVHNHPTLPHILSFWAQLLLNLFLIAGIMYILYSFWATIRSDVDKKSSEAIAELLAEMAVCANQYTTNRCARETRVPAMEVVCQNWEKCMNQDPRNVGRARVSAHTFAEIFNGFIEPISYKAMIFSLILIFGSIAVSNFAFSIFRDKATAAAQQQQQHHHYYQNGLPPPPTPQRQFSGQGGPDWSAYSQQQQGRLEEPRVSPVRRLGYH